MNITIDTHEIITGWYGLPPYTNHTHWVDVDGVTIGTDFPDRQAALDAAKTYIARSSSEKPFCIAVSMNGRNRTYRYATLAAAKAVAEEIWQKTGIIVGVFQ